LLSLILSYDENREDFVEENKYMICNHLLV